MATRINHNSSKGITMKHLKLFTFFLLVNHASCFKNSALSLPSFLKGQISPSSRLTSLAYSTSFESERRTVDFSSISQASLSKALKKKKKEKEEKKLIQNSSIATVPKAK